VTCPTIRVHPAIVAQAAATTAALMNGRFFLGVGTGENLNEHVVGRGWPSADVRLEMLEEAIQVIRLLWRAGRRAIMAGTTRSRTPASTRCPTSRHRSWSRRAGRTPPSWRAATATR
jgi:G6PDH family F420-dependent oxidoreductase